MRGILEELNISERFMSDQCAETEFELETLKIEVNSIKEQKDENLLKIDKINENLRQSLSLEHIRKILCEKCLMLVNMNLEITNKGDTDIIKTVREYHKQSILSHDTDKTVKECRII